MATSVPVPMARPRSAWASAAASLTPSPTIATTAPSAWSRRTTSTLSAGSTSATTSLDADLVGDGAGGPLVVAGQQHGFEAEPAQVGDRLGRRRLHGVGDDEHGPDRSVPADEHGGGAHPLGAASAAASQRRPDRERQLGEETVSTDHDGTAVDDTLDAEALRAAKRLDGDEVEPASSGIGGDRLGDRVLGGVLERGDVRRARRRRPRPRGTTSRSAFDRSSRCRSCRARSCRLGGCSREPRDP